MWWNGRFASWMCSRQICSNCVMLSCQYGPKSLRNVSNTLLNLCHEELRQFWRQKGVQPSTSKVYLIKWPVNVCVCVCIYILFFLFTCKYLFKLYYNFAYFLTPQWDIVLWLLSVWELLFLSLLFLALACILCTESKTVYAKCKYCLPVLCVCVCVRVFNPVDVCMWSCLCESTPVVCVTGGLPRVCG